MCHLPGSRPILSTVSVILNAICAGWERAMSLALVRHTGSDHGTGRDYSAVLLKTSLRRCNHPIGSDCRLVREPKGRGCMTGATSNWPILRLKNSTIKIMAYGHAAC